MIKWYVVSPTERLCVRTSSQHTNTMLTLINMGSVCHSMCVSTSGALTVLMSVSMVLVCCEEVLTHNIGVGALGT